MTAPRDPATVDAFDGVLPSADAAPAPLPTGDRRATLEALRDELARRIPTAEDRDAAALAGRLTAVLEAIAELPAETDETTPLGAMLAAVPD